jgi:hypothetical protein
MIALQEKQTSRFNISKLSHPVNEGLTLQNYSIGSGGVTCAPFWSADAIVVESDRSPPLSAKSWDSSPALLRASGENWGAGSKETPAAGPSPAGLNAKFGVSPYIVVAFFLAVAGAEGALLATSSNNFESLALDPSIVPAANSAIETASLFSVPLTGETPKAVTMPPAQFSLASGKQWQETVGNFKQLIADQKTVKHSPKQPETERVLANLDAWLKAKTK